MSRRIEIHGAGPWRVAVTEMVKTIGSLGEAGQDAVTDSLKHGADLLHEFERRQAQRKWLIRHHPDGTLRPLVQANRHIKQRAHIVERINDRAELWIGYNPVREEALRIREDAALTAKLAHSVKLLDPEALNGYVAFRKRDAPRVYPRSGEGLVGYIPVHGGVTWAQKDGFACVYGFDTMHYNSERVPRTDPEWVRHQCHILYVGLRFAETVHQRYRRGSEAERERLEAEIRNADPDWMRYG